MSLIEGVSLTLRLQLTFVATTALLIWRLRRIYGGDALQLLASGWAFWVLRIVVAIVSTYALTNGVPASAPGRRLLTASAMFLSLSFASYIQAGTLGVAGVSRPVHPARRSIRVALPLALLAGLTTYEGVPGWWRLALVLFSSTLVQIILFGNMTWYLLRAPRDDLTAGRQFAALTYMLFTAKQVYNLVAYIEHGSPGSSPSAYSESVIYALVSMGTVALLLERERQRAVHAEREKRRLEGELAARDRLDSLGRLAGGVAHDFNNMLTAILGNAHLARVRLADWRPGQPPEDVSEELECIENTVTRASALTKQLMAFARRDRIEPVVFDITASVERARKYLAPQLAGTVTLMTESAPTGLFVLGDPDRVEQAIINLVKNAEDALEGKVGRITIRVEPTPAALDGRDAIRICVSDTGIGMDDTVRAHLFEPFFTTKARRGGSGLGLSIVHGAVTQPGGRVEVHSAPGEGTTITMILPRVERDASVPSVDDKSTRDLAGVRVLVVDDDRLVLTVAVRVLKKAGMDVIEASDVEEALAKHAAQLAGLPVQVLLTDLVMPGENGRTLARLLHERDSRIGVVYMSGYEADTFTDETNAPVGPFVSKPFSEQRLLGAIREVLAAVPAGS